VRKVMTIALSRASRAVWWGQTPQGQSSHRRTSSLAGSDPIFAYSIQVSSFVAVAIFTNSRALV